MQTTLSLLVLLLVASPLVLAGEGSTTSFFTVAPGNVFNSTFDTAWLEGIFYFSWTGKSSGDFCNFGVYKRGDDAQYLRNALFFANHTKEFSFQFDHNVPTEGFVIAVRNLQSWGFASTIQYTYQYKGTTTAAERMVGIIIASVIGGTCALCVCYCCVCICCAVLAVVLKKKQDYTQV